MTTDEQAKHIVARTIRILMVDPISRRPISVGTGCILRYCDRDYVVTVEHVANKKDRAACIDLHAPPIGSNSPVYSIGGLHFVTRHTVSSEEDVRMILEGSSHMDFLQGSEHLDIAYAPLGAEIDIQQKELDFGAIIIPAGKKVKIVSNLSCSPTTTEQYGFFGHVRSHWRGQALVSKPTLVMGLSYVDTEDHFHRFRLHRPIDDPEDYQGTSGAPIFGSDGELVGFVAHGHPGEDLLYAFSADVLRIFLNIHASQ